VIIEAPPLLAFHDGEALASVSDVVLLVAEYGRTTATQARRAGELLRRFDAPVLGVVFTGVRWSGDLAQAERTRTQSGRESQLEATRSAAAATPLRSDR
jgi:Mrp family chromosome partitioning ATPase